MGSSWTVFAQVWFQNRRTKWRKKHAAEMATAKKRQEERADMMDDDFDDTENSNSSDVMNGNDVSVAGDVNASPTQTMSTHGLFSGVQTFAIHSLVQWWRQTIVTFNRNTFYFPPMKESFTRCDLYEERENDTGSQFRTLLPVADVHYSMHTTFHNSPVVHVLVCKMCFEIADPAASLNYLS